MLVLETKANISFKDLSPDMLKAAQKLSASGTNLEELAKQAQDGKIDENELKEKLQKSGMSKEEIEKLGKQFSIGENKGKESEFKLTPEMEKVKKTC